MLHEVARECGVSPRTVSRYRKLLNWDDRLRQVRQWAEKEADYDLARAMAESLSLARELKSRFREALQNKRMTDKEVTASELEKITKLESFILGAPESRHEVVNRFADKSEEELEAFIRDGTFPTASS